MSTLSPGLVLTLAALGCAVLAVVEARRRDPRHRAARIAASIAAVVALALLGLYRLAERPGPNESVHEAVLWTQNADLTDVGSGPHFALPRASTAPAGVIRIPDVAYVRREHREIKSVRIRGDGLEPFELAALDGVEVAFEPAAENAATPTVSFAHYPRQLSVGEPMRLQGRIDGLPAGESATFTIIAPDGERAESTVRGEHADSHPFTVVAPAAKSGGRFVWRATAVTGAGRTLLDETLGVAVVRPVLPRVLAIESSPRLDTTHLQRWFAEIGGTLIARATVGKGRHRFTSSSETPAEFSAVDRELLARFDLLLMDATALSGLAPEEREAITAAVMEDGLGVLVLASPDVPPAISNDSLFQWKLERAEDEIPAGELRLARPQWPGLASPIEHPVALENLRLSLASGETALVRDPQGRAIVGARQHGRGTIGVSIARDTWRWRLQDQSQTFAEYWSHLLGELAKPAIGQPQQWFVENRSNEPLSVNRPVQLRLAAAEQPPTAVHVTSDGGPEQVLLPLANDPAEPQHWRSTFWPRHAGWHTVQLAADGARLDFYVHEAHAWASLASARRVAATQRVASRPPARGTITDEQEKTPRQSRVASTIVLYAVFLLSSSYLWLERRRAAA